jgi:hypothetical protein
VNCGEYEGVVCQGYFTDEAGVVADRQRIEDSIARLVEKHGNPIAVVVANDSRGRQPADFAVELADAWGVGDPVEENGILVLVSLEERRVEVATQPGVSVSGEAVTASARTFFQAEDYEGGLLAIVGTLDQILTGSFPPAAPDGDGGGGNGDPAPAIGLLALLGIILAGGGAVWLVTASRRSARTAEARRRQRIVDGDLAALEPAGHELPAIDDYALEAPDRPQPLSTRDALTALRAMADRSRVVDADLAGALWGNGLIIVVDGDALIADTREPLELRASNERPLLEDAVQQAADDALAVDHGDETAFTVRRGELADLISSLRPHRVAAARRRTADTLLAELVATGVGPAAIGAAGHRLLAAGPALDPEVTAADSLTEIDDAYATATAKTGRLEAVYDMLPHSAARPAVAAALADLDQEPESAVAEYEELRQALERDGSTLAADDLDIAAIAALLLMNNDAANHGQFIEAYDANRARGLEPDEAVEYAMAGLLSAGEIERVRAASRRLSLPVSITAALLRRRDDGPEVYARLRDDLAGHVGADTARTIAGILAMSLEPAQALRRWLEAREALGGLGLRGSYADVAAAFGASDPRGARRFALAYAAQRAALSASEIDDADRFAPELAHEGTKDRTDTWTGQRIPGTLGDFDPFTLLFYHWVITRGHGGSLGWEPVYRNSSWSSDRSSWWGGGGGFGSSGGGSWGGSSWSGGSFGGFGGGGGFSSGGGGSW